MPVQINNLAELSAAESLRRSLLNQQLLQTVKRDGMLGLGIGAGGIGLYQLAKLLASPGPMAAQQSLEQPKIVVKRHQQDSVDRDKYATGVSEQDKSAGLYRLLDVIRRNTRPVAPYAEKVANIFGAIRAGATGQAAKTVNQLPYGLSARAVALLAGLGGGAYLAKTLGAEAKEHALNQELEQARAEFESALNETSTPQTKLAQALARIENSAGQLAGAFPNGLNKEAADNLANAMSRALSVYALMALMGAGTAGYYGYKAGVKNQKARRYDLANAARQQRRKIENPYRPVAVLEEDDPSQEGGNSPLY